MSSEIPASPAVTSGRIGVLGGTFDPVHLGHLILAEEARLALSLDRVVFVPAGQPWRKAGQRISPAEDRLAMVQLAIADNPFFAVSRTEIDRDGPTYTADTLALLRQAWGAQTQIWFILGSDAILDVPNWREPDRILTQARLALARRGALPEADVAQLEHLLPALHGRVDWVPMARVEISSSELRRRIRAGTSTRYWLPAPVARYVRDHDLYRPELHRPELHREDASAGVVLQSEEIHGH